MAKIEDFELIDKVAFYTKGSRDIAEHIISIVRNYDRMNNQTEENSKPTDTKVV